MLIDLKKIANGNITHRITIELNQRLPLSLEDPVSLQCEYIVERYDTFYLLLLQVTGKITITCQRCLGTFTHDYLNQSKLAICNSEELAERLMNEYESIVSINDRIDLSEIITDELHLFAPEFHLDFLNCRDEIKEYITP